MSITIDRITVKCKDFSADEAARLQTAYRPASRREAELYKGDCFFSMAKLIGLECNYYKTGNISSATLDGEYCSNSEAGGLKNLCYNVKIRQHGMPDDNLDYVTVSEYDGISKKTAELLIEKFPTLLVALKSAIEERKKLVDKLDDKKTRKSTIESICDAEIAHGGKLSQDFWAIWREEKTAIKRLGYSVKKIDGNFVLVKKEEVA